ncbi:unnamed protein product [Penicillium roqueforti FM164]|uniref:Genomic scaffold, ProqFM164S02 n=1 Tax=Penicillium roqueforti (strain FM164) TaxID=1365484 RepID=W6Q829_PENRF|nr:unnamed protein product [Penicillium roqueforti FM164]
METGALGQTIGQVPDTIRLFDSRIVTIMESDDDDVYSIYKGTLYNSDSVD